MSRAYHFQRNTKPQPPKRNIIDSYKMTFIYHDDIKAFLENDESKIHKMEITCGNIPDACGMFHEAVKKLYPRYYISVITTYPVIKEVKGDEKTPEIKT
jgi:hypothetical protein